MATLTVETRPKTSSAEQNRLRKRGIIPMALLTKSDGTKLIQAPAENLKDILGTKGGLAMFDITQDEGKLVRVVMKDVQRDPVTRRVIHMTVQEILPTDVLKVAVPLKFVGEPASVTKRTSNLMTPMSTLEVQAIATSVPDSIEIDVSAMSQNDRIVASDLTLPEGVTLLSNPATVVASTKQGRGMADEEGSPAEEAVAPATAESAPSEE